eukprot:TRINITY_DN20_c0_g1_i2.p1 TRINITY_DN20_c0_g1~~TRINITY_DN20_c0_g1_i2.p1  ORF type:complete len:123 (-),score=12.33 TRINITY_DN20_c0_g1_i2:74-442(-)
MEYVYLLQKNFILQINDSKLRAALTAAAELLNTSYLSGEVTKEGGLKIALKASAAAAFSDDKGNPVGETMKQGLDLLIDQCLPSVDVSNDLFVGKVLGLIIIEIWTNLPEASRPFKLPALDE